MSPQPCTICSDERRPEIDEALVDGEPGRSVARRFDIPEASVRRHRSNHLDEGALAGTTVPIVDEEPDRELDLQAVARERLEQERSDAETATLRRYELEEAERRRRDDEAREAEHERALARTEVRRLSAERAQVVATIERSAEDLARAVQELDDLDMRHRRALSAAGEPYPSRLPGELVGGYLAGMIGGRVAPLDPYSRHPRDPVKPLRERDPLVADLDEAEEEVG